MVSPAGIVRVVTRVPEIKPYPSVFSLEGSFMDFRAEHPEKALEPISVMVSEITTLVMERLSLNVEDAIWVTV